MINASSKIRLYINNTEYTDYLIEGSLSDDSAYTTNIITTKGTVVLGGDTSILDFKKNLFPVGSTVTVYATLSDGKLAKLPRGHLYVLSSSINVNERLTTLEVGCSLAFLASREAFYENQIRSLIENSFSTQFKSAFVIDEYNLSTLDSLLKTAGKCIFQDKYGYVQDIDQFGDDGIGVNFAGAKLVSFDKHTAINIESLGGSIEELPSAVYVEVDIDVPGEEDDDEDGNDGKPEPFITSEVERTVTYTDAEIDTFQIVNDTTGGQATTEAIPSCGSIEEPGSPKPPDFAYTVTGNASTFETTKSERAVSGSFARYDGPGNQADWEYNFEWCSALTYASSMLSTVVNKYVDFANSEAEKAKGLLSKANQYFATAKDLNERDLSEKTQQEIDRIKNAYEYYTCLGTQLYEAAEDIAGVSAGYSFAANGMGKKARDFIDKYTGIYGISNISMTYYTYGEGDVLIKKVELSYIHASQAEAAQKTTANLKASYRLNANVSGFRYSIINDINFAGYRATTGSFDGTIEGSNLPTQHSDQHFTQPERYFNQFLKSRTTTTYEYGSNYTTEVVVFEDFENSDNNYVRNNYSSSGSKNAEESDRIELERDANGCIILNNENADEPVKLEHTVAVADTSGTVPAGWLGIPASTTKEISIPATFAPIAKKNCGGVISNPDLTSTLALYQSIVEKFARNEAKRIAGDNMGYRITEAGTRAEIFGYYPFYPISLTLHSLGKQFKLRGASSNWVFDSSNVLCSIDCFNVGEIAFVEGATEPSPYVFTDTEIVDSNTTTVIDNSFFDYPDNADSIVINSLPTGVTFENNGVPISVGDQITITDINAGNITATTDGSTTEIFVSYEVVKTDGNDYNGLDDLFPSDTVTYISSPFADAGEFTDNTTNGGSDADGGEFTTNTNGAGVNLNAGDFDTGAEVLNPEPLNPSGASESNNSVDPEAVFGINLVDNNNNTIASDNLATPNGNITPTLDVVIDFALNLSIRLRLDTTIQPQPGWDYGYVAVSRGTGIDMGSIDTPNTFNANFGTVASANEPTLASYVV